MELAALRGEEPPPPHDTAFVEMAVAAQADVFLVRARSMAPPRVAVSIHHHQPARHLRPPGVTARDEPHSLTTWDGNTRQGNRHSKFTWAVHEQRFARARSVNSSYAFARRRTRGSGMVEPLHRADCQGAACEVT